MSFFCIKPRLIQIGDSEPALEFVIIAEPDEWEKTVKSNLKISDRNHAYRQFWSELIAAYQKKVKSHKNINIPKKYLLRIYAGKTGFSYGWRFSNNRPFLLTLWINTKDKELNARIIDHIKDKKHEIESKVGYNLQYFKKDNIRVTAVNFLSNIDTDIMDLKGLEREELINWAVESMIKFRNALDPIINNLD